MLSLTKLLGPVCHSITTSVDERENVWQCVNSLNILEWHHRYMLKYYFRPQDDNAGALVIYFGSDVGNFMLGSLQI